MSDMITRLDTQPRILRLEQGEGEATFQLAFFKSLPEWSGATVITGQDGPRYASLELDNDPADGLRLEDWGELGIALSPPRYVSAKLLYRPAGAARSWKPREVKIDVAVGADWTATLMVPMSLHALNLAHDRVGALPTADFTRLPHVGPEGDVNPNAAHLGRELETRPFEDLGFPMRKGVHLHWTLPACYRRGTTTAILADLDLDLGEFRTLHGGHVPQKVFDALHAAGLWPGVTAEGAIAHSTGKGERWILVEKKGTRQVKLRIAQRLTFDEYGRPGTLPVCRVYDPRIRFPPAPDRWLIVRHGTAPRRWILESDRLAPATPDGPGVGVAYPTGTEAHDAVPYGRLGRVFDAEDWLRNSAPLGVDETRIPDLTVVGYGDPEFAAFYPNCYSVFGFHDVEAAGMTEAQRADLAYTVIGWHADAGKDILRSPGLEEQVEQLLQKAGAEVDNAGFDVLRRDALSAALGWEVGSDGPALFPETTTCYTHIDIGGGPQHAGGRRRRGRGRHR